MSSINQSHGTIMIFKVANLLLVIMDKISRISLYLHFVTNHVQNIFTALYHVMIAWLIIYISYSPSSPRPWSPLPAAYPWLRSRSCGYHYRGDNTGRPRTSAGPGGRRARSGAAPGVRTGSSPAGSDARTTCAGLGRWPEGTPCYSLQAPGLVGDITQWDSSPLNTSIEVKYCVCILYGETYLPSFHL